MYLLFICLCLPLLSKCADFDPDIDICTNTLLDAAVQTDEEKSYIFKGKYFWQIKNLVTNVGSISYADLITNKWPELKGKVKAAFTVKKPNSTALVTFFLIDDSFYVYEKGVKILDGSTKGWASFSQLKMTTAFTKFLDIAVIFVLHTNNTQYSIVNFNHSLTKPTIDIPKTATIRDQTIFFIDQEVIVNKIANDPTLNQWLDVRAVITYLNKVVMIGSKQYCIIDMTATTFDKSCNRMDNTSYLIGCPIDIKDRPTTVATTLTTSEGIKSSYGTVDQNGTEVIRTFVPTPTVVNTTEILSDKSAVYVIAFNSTLICVTIIIMIIIIVISQIINKRPKGTVYQIK